MDPVLESRMAQNFLNFNFKLLKMSRSKRKPYSIEPHLETGLYWRPIRRVTKERIKTLNSISFNTKEDVEEFIYNFEIKSPKIIVADWRYSDRIKKLVKIKKRYDFNRDFWYGIDEIDLIKLKRK